MWREHAPNETVTVVAHIEYDAVANLIRRTKRLLEAQPVGDPPFADSDDSPTVIGVGPWGTFAGMSVGAF